MIFILPNLIDTPLTNNSGINFEAVSIKPSSIDILINIAPMMHVLASLFILSLIAAYILLKMAKTDETQPASDNFDSHYNHYLQSSKKTIFGGSTHE